MAETKNLKDRLTRQLAARGVKDASGKACALLKQRGDADKSCKLTDQGKRKEARGAAGRAKDRAAKYSGKHKPEDYKYSPKTNRATLNK